MRYYNKNIEKLRTIEKEGKTRAQNQSGELGWKS